LNLAIDIGNTLTKFGLFKGRNLIKQYKIPTAKIVNTLQLFKKISQSFTITQIGISSVVPEIDFFMKNPCKVYFKINPVFISAKNKLPVKIKTEKPLNTGADRICNAVAGYEYYKHKENVIISAFGTAVTYDVILKNGDFIGGLIAPGAAISAKALHAYAGKLPLIIYKNLNFPKNIVANNTVDSMKSGIVYSALYSVEGIIKQIEKIYKRKFKVIITGGDSGLFRNRLSIKAEFIDDLVLKGINEILEYNPN